MWLATWTIVTLQQYLPLNPDGIAQHGADARVQHDLELHDEHEPAALQRRDRPVVLLADVRDQLPAVRDRRDGRGGVRRRDSRPGRQPADDSSATSTSISRARRSASSCRSRCRVGHPDVAGHADDVRGRRQGDDGRRAGADDRPRRDRRRRVDQAARHQRRRLLRTELGASVRESDAALELRRDLVDHHHPDVDGLDARPHGRPPPAGGRDLRDDAGASTSRWSSSASRRRRPATRRSRRWASTSRPARWKARRSASARACRRSGR